MSVLQPRPGIISLNMPLLALAAMLQSAPTAAQDATFRFELTPYAGYRLGGTFHEQDGERQFDVVDSAARGLILSGRVRDNTQWEVLLGLQDTEVDTRWTFVEDPILDIDVDYLHVGGTYLFDGERVRPFIAFTLGATHFDPAPGNFASESYFSASIGAGWQLNAMKRVGIRLEARAYTTFVRSDSEIFCQSDGGGTCLIVVGADTLTQWEARAGLVMRF